MIDWLRQRAGIGLVIASVAIAVIALGALQYRWNRDASEATGVRLADALQLSIVNWHLDLFRTLAEPCLAMPATMDAPAAGNLDRYVERIADWRAVARYPAVIAGVYVVGGPAGARQVSGLVRGEQVFRRTTLPEGLAAAVDDPAARLLAQSSPLGSRAEPDDSDAVHDLVRGALADWHFDPAAAALARRLGAGPATGWLVIALDRDVLQRDILPDLAHRYFQGTDGLDYQVAVTTGGTPRRVLYTSDPEFGGLEVPDIDGWLNVFGRPLEPAGGSPLYIFQTTADHLRPTAAVGVAWFPLLRDAPPREDWQLVVRHRRGGSLRHFVADLRRRGLMVSAGALLLLVASLSMLVVTSSRAERLARMQMDFVTAVSHEFRTPLTVIGSAADNLAAGVVDRPEQLRAYGAAIGTEVSQLSSLVERILLFAALREGRQHYTMEPLDVASAIDSALASTDGLIRSGGFAVERDVDPDLPRVTGDRFAVSQILENLITNAIKYGQVGQWIGIRARAVVDSRGATDVQISVADRGVGVAPTDLPRIFEPFYRSAAARSSQIHGTGLGLAIAKQLADAMGASLDVTSSPGRGTTFTLHLFTGTLHSA